MSGIVFLVVINLVPFLLTAHKSMIILRLYFRGTFGNLTWNIDDTFLNHRNLRKRKKAFEL